ncbi:MAG: aminoglycoside phosphotransferase family protein [Alphaproteobacteria bacterium]|nr:aminoglycoside phosphotransferase family protein [Alphaproteobacteria bacterium]
MRKVIAKGAHSIVYEDGGTIIKQPLGESGGDYYIDKQAIGYDVVKELLESGQDIGVNLPGLISIDREKRRIVEKRINGVDLRTEVYDSLTERQKDAIAKQMALFLNSMHQLRKPQNPEHPIKHIFDSYKNCPNSAKEIIDAFKNKLSEKAQKPIIDAEKYLMAAPISDEIHVMTHKDLRNQNVMYDEKEQKLAVIDFELAGVGNIYQDFVPYAPASIISWDFTKRIVKSYNSIPDKKYPVAVDIEKVRNALVYGIAHEFARCQKMDDERGQNMNLSTEKRSRILEAMLSGFVF